MVGIILGQQNGRDITMEHAFECKASHENGCIVMDPDWFTERLEQCQLSAFALIASPSCNLTHF